MLLPWRPQCGLARLDVHRAAVRTGDLAGSRDEDEELPADGRLPADPTPGSRSTTTTWVDGGSSVGRARSGHSVIRVLP